MNEILLIVILGLSGAGNLFLGMMLLMMTLWHRQAKRDAEYWKSKYYSEVETDYVYWSEIVDEFEQSGVSTPKTLAWMRNRSYPVEDGDSRVQEV